MSFSAPTTYIPRQSPLHALDARVKLVLLLAYSISLFFLNTWAGLGLAAAALVATVALGRLPVRPLLAPLVPLYVLVAVTVVLNCLNGGGGNPGFDAQRMLAALMVGIRILLLAWASLAVTYSTASNQLMEAFASFLHPLRKLGAPVDDVALTLSLALRFIPLVAQQMEAVRRAQYSRGAAFDAGALAAIKAWGGTLVPVLVGMFRRGEVLATSMEARCYGAPGPRTRLASNPFTPANALVAIAGLAGCVCACLFL